MGIHIEPSLELVWRDPRTIQLGVDPMRAIVDVPTTPDERFLSAIRRETARDALPAIAEHLGCAPTSAAAVLGAAAPAMVEATPLPHRLVEVHGSGAVADRLVEHLRGEDVDVIRTDAPPGGPVPLPDPEPHLAVLVTDHVVDPVVRSTWSRRLVPQLPVVIGDGTVRVGPVLEPDAGACLACMELWRVDEDPVWPVIAGQLWGRRLPPPSPWRADGIAATVCGLVLARLPDGRSPTPRSTSPTPSFSASPSVAPSGRQLRVDRTDLTVTPLTLGPHPRCSCRALPRNDSVDAHRRGTHRAPTT
ncbi:hypothetical protein [Curtobacterium sp. Leaf261]|uniref:hypothetical protein n=1 Tax=Curtobacterium sp. Leaf261 TaxID=1736311 RepID=UPI0006F3925E|nr:hypothetical protein [Curtobacterium sp. Leaf261]KQO62912.1 hypothetical protein ASF23_08340 [Curtobacterium sp. Leaf261]